MDEIDQYKAFAALREQGHDASAIASRFGVTERMKEMRDTGITQLRATIAEQAELLGVALEDLVPKQRRRRKGADDA